MQKIITDKKPFVTERTESITMTKEARLHNQQSVDEHMMERARKKGIPEGILPVRASLDSLDLLVWEFVWFEVLL